MCRSTAIGWPAGRSAGPHFRCLSHRTRRWFCRVGAPQPPGRARHARRRLPLSRSSPRCAPTSRSRCAPRRTTAWPRASATTSASSCPTAPSRFLLNPRGLLWSEIQADDIVLVDARRPQARRPPRGRADRDVHPRRRPPPRQGLRAAHPHAVRDRADADRRPRPRHARCRRTRCASTAASRSTRTTTASRSTTPKASASPARWAGRRRLPRQPRRRSSAASSCRHAYDDLYYLERACLHQVLAQSTGRPLAPVDESLARARGRADARASGCSRSCSSRRCGGRCDWQFLADAVLCSHVALMLFVVLGLPLIVVGNLRRWRWVNSPWLRFAHLATIAVVAGEAWLGIVCPLTTLEMWLRAPRAARRPTTAASSSTGCRRCCSGRRRRGCSRRRTRRSDWRCWPRGGCGRCASRAARA